MKRLTSILILSLSLYGCKNKLAEDSSFQLNTGSDIVGLASPIVLESDTTWVDLTDYLDQKPQIQAVKATDQSLWLQFDPTTYGLTISGRCKHGIAAVIINLENTEYAIPVKNASKAMINYEIILDNAKEVQLAGDFNGWQPSKNPLQKDGSKWFANLELYPGNYAYQVVIDDKWQLDPNEPEQRSNGMGGYNSVMKVPFQKGPITLHNTLTKHFNQTCYFSSNEATQVRYFFIDNHLFKIDTGAGAFTVDLPPFSDQRHFLRVWTGIDGKVSNEIKVPLNGNSPVLKYDELTRNDKERNIMYFMMVDRFCNGDSTNDEPLNDDRVAPRANYQGGDLAGIKKKVDEGYFDKLGVNTLWISPITQNPLGAYQEFPSPRRYYSGYHGYWPIRYKKVDHRFGDDEILKSLLAGAHEKNYNVILDFVANHVHEEHPMIKANPSFKTQLILEDGTKNIRIWDAQRLTTWFDEFLPSLDFTQEKVIEMVSDSAMHWMTSFEFDGFRHDATKHIPESFWRATSKKLKTNARLTGKNYFQVGETFGDRTLIQQYINTGMMDGQFDFNVYFDARAVFQDTSTSFEVLAASLQSSLNIHGDLHLMCNITGNHDLPRFISYASGAIAAHEDEKEVGWERNISVIDTLGYDRLKLLQTFIATIPGIPVIYYGDEIGMPGANDPDNRRMMRFAGLSSREKHVFNHLQEVLNWRKEHLALIYGDLQILTTEKQIMVFKRQYLSNEVIVCFNKSAKPMLVRIPINSASINWQDLSSQEHYQVENGFLILTLPAYKSTMLVSISEQ